MDVLNREKERRLAYLGQLEIRLTEKEQALRQASDERAELRDQLIMRNKEQRENLQQHQKLLEIERGKLQEMEEEKERQLRRMRDLEISFSTDKERLCERVGVLESALADKDHVLTQQADNLALLTSELE